MKVFVLGMVLVSLLISCEKPLGVDLPYEGDRLVVYSVLTADSIIQLDLQKTYPPTGSYQFADSIKGARVSLFENETYVEELTRISKRTYASISQIKAQVGRSYSFRISAPGYPTIETLPVIVPQAVNLESFRFEEKIQSIYNSSYPCRKLSCRFFDDPNQINFYAVQIKGYYQQLQNVVNSFNLDRPDDFEDACGFKSAGVLNEFNLTDLCRDGNSMQVNLGVETKGAVQPTGFTQDCDELELIVRCVTQGYFEYNRTFNTTEGFLQAFQPPNVRYSNVIGGYGIVMATNVKKVRLL